ncbi:MAG: hypothetical protein IKN10_01965 [Muribaculaceae bacterium]|nr:hypothetical protein [Muribaculaceae bacterium]
MKIKLTTLLFGLLLAVGWTSSAFAQDLYLPTAVHNKAYYDALEYTWEDANGNTHTSKATDVADDPYQMYELIRFVYGNPAFPGPTYGAYTSSFTVEDPITYHPIPGGWNITAATAVNRDITINVTNNRSWDWGYTYYPVLMKSIKVMSGETEVAKLEYTEGMSQLPDGWTPSTQLSVNGDGDLYFNNTQNATLTISSSLLTGYNNLTIVIEAKATNADYAGSLSINNQSKTVNQTSYNNFTWNVTLPEEGAFVQGTVIPPYENGYTALMVAVKNEATAADEDGGTSAGIVGSRARGSYYNSKARYIQYFADRVAFIKLLTDGLRIGNEEEHSTGTVFNCAGTYNKFFIISKGKAREKSYRTKYNHIGNTNDWWNSNNWYYGETFPFQDMFEEFSPTTGAKGDQITDFYNEMMDGKIYSVVHDCASVIQEAHQFSMSGNSGTQAYAMDGLNFFIPDFRLTYWKGTDDNGRSVDGRDMNPYEYGNDNGKTGRTFSLDSYYWTTYFAQYNPQYAPKVGIYKITLEADAKKAPGYDPDAPKYEVTLNWVSSLNEMTGEMVPQTYTIWKVTYNADGTETREKIATVQDETNYTYEVDQEEESYTITYIVEGHPTPDDNSDYPSFVAWSNLDDVVIPGLSDFLSLALDHYESDFVIGDKLGEEKNYYRNFLHVTGDGEGEKALTLERINAGENEFKLYRQTVVPESSDETLVGTLSFWDRKDGKNVGYGFSFAAGQEVYEYDLKTNEGQTITNAYEHSKIGMPSNNNGFDLRIKGNGDIVIYPNGYAVNFKSITVKNGNTTVASWTVSDGDIVANKGWYLSPGSRWIRDAGTDYYYLEGGGYIAIPNMLNTYDNLTVTINGFGDAGNLATIAVNDHKQTLANADNSGQHAKDYTWTVTSKYYKYVKVTDQSQLTDGEYLIVNDANSVAFDGSKDNLDAAANYVNVEIVSNAIMSTPLIENATFTIDMTGTNGTIKSSSGKYIGGLEADKNGMQQSADNAFTNSITINQTAIGDVVYNAVITNNGKYLRYNPQSGQNRFRYYKQENLEPIHLYKKVEAAAPTTTHSVRLVGLPIIDQFAENVSKNDHPSRYGYILKYEPKADADPETDAGKAKSSSRVEVPVQHTGSAVNGYYTETEVKNDTVRELKLNVMAADMDMTLSNSNSAIYYYTILASENEMPHNNDSTYYVSNMQQNNFKYQEMYTKSGLHGQVYEAGEHHFYDSIPATGSYGESYKTYVPYIKQRAIDRYYYVEDSLHNTYGSPIWATGVGKVDKVSANVQPQQGWNTTWTDNGSCRLYMLDKVKADGYLPLNTKTDGSVLSNIEYEPYMFRIFVESPSGKLRHFQYVTDDNGNRVIAAKEGSTTGPWCVWSEYLTLDENGDPVDNTTNGVTFSTTDENGNLITGYLHFQKDKVERDKPENEGDPKPEWDKDDNNAIFGALTSIETGEDQAINAEDLTIYVRFYYKSTGKPIESMNGIMLRADGADAAKSFYAVEKPATAKQGPTAVEEIRYHGEVVSTTYYNVQGIESDKPFDGVNIVVTRFSDGTTSVSKVVR